MKITQDIRELEKHIKSLATTPAEQIAIISKAQSLTVKNFDADEHVLAVYAIVKNRIIRNSQQERKMTTHITTPLYAIARNGADQKWQEADAMIDAGKSYLEIAEFQKCAAILESFAAEIYNAPAMWETVHSAQEIAEFEAWKENDFADTLADVRREAKYGKGL